jgi:hypothetical protein
VILSVDDDVSQTSFGEVVDLILHFQLVRVRVSFDLLVLDGPQLREVKFEPLSQLLNVTPFLI